MKNGELKMADLILSHQNHLLGKARRLAVRRNSPLNAAVKEKLEEFVSASA